jgi:drug/metabolite transporter (DMT)-like permease
VTGRSGHPAVETSGVVAALAAAAMFSTSGTLLKPLLDAGWSPGAAVLARIAGAALVLIVPSFLALRGRFSVIAVHGRVLIAYGVIAVAGTQLLYFAAIERIPIGVALLIQYSAPVMVLAVTAIRSRSRPSMLSLAGALISMIGLVVVIAPGASGPVDVTGVLLAVAAAGCLAGYYLLSARATPGLPPVALIAGGMIVGTAVIALASGVGLIPFAIALEDVAVTTEITAPWFVPMVLVILVATVAAYLASLSASRILGSRVASFLGLTEVVFAIALAWLALAQVPTVTQLLGGVLVIAGVVLVRLAPSGTAGASAEARDTTTAAPPPTLSPP